MRSLLTDPEPTPIHHLSLHDALPIYAEIEKSGGPWLLGREVSLADIALMPAIVRMADLDQATAWQDLPRVQHWYDAVCRRSEEHTSELQSPMYLVCRLLLEKKNNVPS